MSLHVIIMSAINATLVYLQLSTTQLHTIYFRFRFKVNIVLHLFPSVLSICIFILYFNVAIVSFVSFFSFSVQYMYFFSLRILGVSQE